MLLGQCKRPRGCSGQIVSDQLEGLGGPLGLCGIDLGRPQFVDLRFADLAAQLRYELEMTLLRTRCAVSPGYRRQVRMLRERHDLQVHLGCGNAVLADWINVDCYPPPRKPGREILTLDMRRGLPFASGSVQAVFTEHFLEHLPFETPPVISRTSYSATRCQSMCSISCRMSCR